MASSTVSNDRGDVTAVLGQQHPADTAPQLTGDGDEDPGGLSSGLREAGMYERDPRAKEEDLYRMPTLSTAPNEVAWNGSNGKEDGTLSLTNRPERALVQSLVMPSPTIFCVSASGKYQEEGDEIRVLARTPDGDTQMDLTEGVVAVAEFPQSMLPPSPGGVSPARREEGKRQTKASCTQVLSNRWSSAAYDDELTAEEDRAARRFRWPAKREGPCQRNAGECCVRALLHNGVTLHRYK